MDEKRTETSLQAFCRNWRVTIGLLCLSFVPVAAGVFRMTQLATGADLPPDKVHLAVTPLPVVLHVVSAALFAVLGAIQFVPSLRRGRATWHRAAGRFALPAGYAVAGTALWMTAFYDLPPQDGPLLNVMRYFVGVGMLGAALSTAVWALLRRNYPLHGDAMIIAYALGMGAGTQVVVGMPWVLLVGTPGQTANALLMGLGWLINLKVAERVIRARRRARQALASAGIPLPPGVNGHQPSVAIVHSRLEARPVPGLPAGVPPGPV